VFCHPLVLKLGLHGPPSHALPVVSNERAPIASVLILFGIVLMLAATAPTCWSACASPSSSAACRRDVVAVVTLTTRATAMSCAHVGGPHDRALLMIAGITVLALMTGVLATGFAQEGRRREYLRVWDQVARVPIFASLGVVTLSEIVGKLRTRYYPPASPWCGAATSAIRCSSSPARSRSAPAQRRIVRLADGAFFGEMALPNAARTASVATTKPTTRSSLCQRFLRDRVAHPGPCEAVEVEARRAARESRRQPGDAGR